MLVEQRDVRQNPGELYRRLFWDDTLDLAVWLLPDGLVDRFQLSYDPEGSPRALTWSRTSGFVHSAIDLGDEDVLSNRAPLLHPIEMIDARQLRAQFQAVAHGLPPEIFAAVDPRLSELAQI